MILSIVHRTDYAYAQTVSESLNETRLRPISNEDQVCHSFEIEINPPAPVSHYLDFFLNMVHVFEINQPHRALSVVTRSLVETFPPSLPTGAVVSFESLGATQTDSACYDFLQASHFVSTDVPVWKLAMDWVQERTDVLQACQKIMKEIYEGFEYCTEVTNVHTHLTEVLDLRKGVCQDFTHVMIGVCRCLGIPARYVSGYLFTNPGPEALRGTEASHAWCEVFLPTLGWRGFDPTNNQMADGRYVKLAIGRDYHDVPPVRGTYRGSRSRRMTVGVSVRQAEIGREQ
jgi:transglutaminase-like putative cysteine protease